MGRYIIQISLLISILFALFSCESDGYLTSPDARLRFSKDTVTFDTIFTTIGSTTQRFTVHNTYSENILISNVKLSGGDLSSFRLNINGEVSNEVFDVEIPANDSIFIFVEVTVDPNGQNLPMVVQDSIQFTTNSNIQNIQLIAYGQDFKLVKAETIKTTTWTSEKPYLVYDYAFVDSSSVLTIEPGTKVYFHKGAGLYVKGKIKANGNFQEQIYFIPDRLEKSYENIPDQWNGIVLFSGSHDNVFNYCHIRNANIGLQVGTIENAGYASAKISNTKIENMAYAGLFAIKSKISAYNDLIANCGFYAVALLVGGDYQFNHTTVANYWGNYSTKARSTSSLVISNVLIVQDSKGGSVTYNGDLENATFGNSIIFGNNIQEIELGDNGKNKFNYLFENCIIQAADTFNISNKEHYLNVWKGPKYDPLFIDPYKDYNFELDTLSPAKDAGKIEIGDLYQYDLLNKDRTTDKGPDLGAYERIEKKNAK